MDKNIFDKTSYLNPAEEILSGAADAAAKAGAIRIPPDMGLCEDCLKELYAEADPRFQHPFISCTHCGPRFSIIKQKLALPGSPALSETPGSPKSLDRQAVPLQESKGPGRESLLSSASKKGAGRTDSVLSYEKDATTMAEFPMCGFCDVQYTDKEDRHYHAPALSCHACGPKLRWQEQAPRIPQADAVGAAPNPDEDTNAALQMILGRSAHLRTAPDDSPAARHTSADDRRILDRAAQILADGGVIAFKTFNGYYLAADPFHADAAARMEKILRGGPNDFQANDPAAGANGNGAGSGAPAADTSGQNDPAAGFTKKTDSYFSPTMPVLFRDLNEVRYYLRTDETAEKLLTSSARPVVLLDHKLNDNGFSKSAGRRFPMTEDGTPDPSFEYLRKSRVMAAVLPSMAAQYLLLDRISPLFFVNIAAAVANHSPVDMVCNDSAGDIAAAHDDSLIAGFPADNSTDDAEMLAWFSRQPDIGGILYHDVQITSALPDSVMQITDGQPRMLLRAKGFVPLPVITAAPADLSSIAAGVAGEADAASGKRAGNIDAAARVDADSRVNTTAPVDAIAHVDAAAPVDAAARADDTGTSETAASRPGLPEVFAAGTEGNSSFVLGSGTALYPSQPLGDLGSAAAQRTYQKTLSRMEDLLDIHPTLAVCDMDPLSETTRFAKTYAMEHGLPLLQVQRDHARIASVMAEHGLTGPVIGVSFGEAGYGTDGALWGGDILLCEGAGCQRLAHLIYGEVHNAKLILTEGTDQTTAAASDTKGCPQFVIDISDILEFAADNAAAGSAPGTEGSSASGMSPSVATGTTTPSFANAESVKTVFGTSFHARNVASEAGPSAVRSSSINLLMNRVAELLGIGCSSADRTGADLRLTNRAGKAGGFGSTGGTGSALEEAAIYAREHPGQDPASDLALAFYGRLIDAIVGECVRIREEYGADQVALSGSCFRSRTLLEGALQKLRGLGFRTYVNAAVSPDDSCVALGQAYIATHAMCPQ